MSPGSSKTMTSSTQCDHSVNFSNPRNFRTAFKRDVKETLFPDDPFPQFRDKSCVGRARKVSQYFIPIISWLPNYNFQLFRYDVLAGITIASLAIPQGISYAKLANLPIVIGLYSSFVPPLVYAIFGSSKHLAVGPVAASSLLIASTIGEKVSVLDDPTLYLHLVFTATFITGVFQAALGVFRLGMLLDFLSHSTIVGFMGGTATIISLQQLKGMLGLKHFTTKTDAVLVIRSILDHKDEWRWESAVAGLCFLAFLMFTRFLRKKNPKLFWVSAMAPMASVIIGCVFAYYAHAEEHGIQIVGQLKKGINPFSFKDLNFNSSYISATLKAGIITGFLALAEGIAIGRSFAAMKNDQIDGNKEMVAFGLMNIIGSFTSCYLTTGPFSKTAINFNAGCKTAMSNVVMAFFMMLVLLFMAPLFKYTPLVSLSAIIMSAMFGLIDYDEAYHLYKIEKFDFCICMVAFFGVTFISMDLGLLFSIALSIIRALLYVARPAPCKLGNLPNTSLFRDTEQYPDATEVPGILVFQLGSPIYFANCSYIRERISRWIREEKGSSSCKRDDVEFIFLDLGGVTCIDSTGIETLIEIRRSLEACKIKMLIVNPRIEVMEKLMISKFVDIIGKDSIFLSIEDAIRAAQFSMTCEC